jgi:thiol-disulfide isomerase/thioredoxin
MRKFRRRRVAAAVSALLLAVLIACSRQTPPTPVPQPDTKAAGVPAADTVYGYSFSDPDGKLQALSQWKGKLLVLNFWATWCGPCVAEMPDLEKAQQAFAGQNVVIVALGTESPTRVREFRDQHRLHLNLLAGGYDALTLARGLGNTQGVLPYTVLVSTDGKVLQTQTGPLLPGQLRGWITAAP